MLFIMMKLSLLATTLLGGRGGEGVVYFSDDITKIPCHSGFMLSDPGVPRNFVIDCSLSIGHKANITTCTCSRVLMFAYGFSLNGFHQRPKTHSERAKRFNSHKSIYCIY